MKQLTYLLILSAALGAGIGIGTSASAQSAGGGGGADRPTKVVWAAESPVQMNASRSTCGQLQDALQIFGKLRINSLSPFKKSLYKIVSTRSLVWCTDPRQISSFRVKTADRASCSVGYVCKETSAGR
jgi:hypothetical protein